MVEKAIKKIARTRRKEEKIIERDRKANRTVKVIAKIVSHVKQTKTRAE